MVKLFEKFILIWRIYGGLLIMKFNRNIHAILDWLEDNIDLEYNYNVKYTGE